MLHTTSWAGVAEGRKGAEIEVRSGMGKGEELVLRRAIMKK
ncbi:hypothetical protein [Geobacter hydrogenophilus]|nr:hypothetical protein [Geobacter hydrogenophilus]